MNSLKQTEIYKTGIIRPKRAYKKMVLLYTEYKRFHGIEFEDLSVSGRKNVKEGALVLFLKKAEKG